MDGTSALSHKRTFFMAKTPAFLSTDWFNINDTNRLRERLHPSSVSLLSLSLPNTDTQTRCSCTQLQPTLCVSLPLAHTWAHKRHRALSWFPPSSFFSIQWKRSCLTIISGRGGWSGAKRSSKGINHLFLDALVWEQWWPDIPELSENCGTSQTTAVSVSVAWTVGGDLHLSITGGSVS